MTDSFKQLSRDEQIACYEHLAHAALARYPIAVDRIESLGWAVNVIFRVEGRMGDAPGVFGLRIKAYGQESTELIEGEMQWLAAIRRDTDLAVPEPVAALDGSLVQEVEVAQVPGGKQCVLYRWVEGVQKRADELQPLDMQRVGTFMARLHDHATAFAPDHEASPRRKMNWRWQVGNWAKGRRETELPYTEDELQMLDEASALFLERILAFDQRDHFGLIHGDMHQGNFLINGNAVAAIDFESCMFNYFTYDMAHCLKNLQERPDIAALKDAFFAGYAQVRPLPPEREEALVLFWAMREMSVLNWYIEADLLAEEPDHAPWVVRQVRAALDKVQGGA